jgi:hypothetical protein
MDDADIPWHPTSIPDERPAPGATLGLEAGIGDVVKEAVLEAIAIIVGVRSRVQMDVDTGQHIAQLQVTEAVARGIVERNALFVFAQGPAYAGPFAGAVGCHCYRILGRPTAS